ncbi:MAG: KEOPS complex kinase/ATPase Bud32 [Candidatus Jordarchaeales archaeon]
MIIRKGAEAYLFLKTILNRMVVVKERRPKSYRVKDLDVGLRKQRVFREARLLHSAKKVGVPTPTVYLVDPESTSIVMDRIEGVTLSDLIRERKLSREELTELLRKVGVLIGRLHKGGIVHGDLTTSNMIVSDGKVFLIDFGLGDFSKNIEDLGVDLHLMKRAMESSHYDVFEEGFNAVLEGYREAFEGANEVIEKMFEIERRGRYWER